MHTKEALGLENRKLTECARSSTITWSPRSTNNYMPTTSRCSQSIAYAVADYPLLNSCGNIRVH
jgi:hypothetical protein